MGKNKLWYQALNFSESPTLGSKPQISSVYKSSVRMEILHYSCLLKCREPWSSLVPPPNHQKNDTYPKKQKMWQRLHLFMVCLSFGLFSLAEMGDAPRLCILSERFTQNWDVHHFGLLTPKATHYTWGLKSYWFNFFIFLSETIFTNITNKTFLFWAN